MSQLPGVANAILDDRKITQYLLSTVHATGASRAKFFISFGFPEIGQSLKARCRTIRITIR
jgi:hypothetical protein